MNIWIKTNEIRKEWVRGRRSRQNCWASCSSPRPKYSRSLGCPAQIYSGLFSFLEVAWTFIQRGWVSAPDRISTHLFIKVSLLITSTWIWLAACGRAIPSLIYTCRCAPSSWNPRAPFWHFWALSQALRCLSRRGSVVRAVWWLFLIRLRPRIL